MIIKPGIWLRVNGSSRHVAHLELTPDVIHELSNLLERYRQAIEVSGLNGAKIQMKDALVPVRFFDRSTLSLPMETARFVTGELDDPPPHHQSFLSMALPDSTPVRPLSLMQAVVGEVGVGWEGMLTRTESIGTGRLHRSDLLLARCALADDETLRERFIELAERAPHSALRFIEDGFRLPDDPRPRLAPADVLRPEDLAPMLEVPGRETRIRVQTVLASLRGKPETTGTPRPRGRTR